MGPSGCLKKGAYATSESQNLRDSPAAGSSLPLRRARAWPAAGPSATSVTPCEDARREMDGYSLPGTPSRNLNIPALQNGTVEG
jgi:hypothetical protein